MYLYARVLCVCVCVYMHIQCMHVCICEYIYVYAHACTEYEISATFVYYLSQLLHIVSCHIGLHHSSHLSQIIASYELYMNIMGDLISTGKLFPSVLIQYHFNYSSSFIVTDDNKCNKCKLLHLLPSVTMYTML